MVYVVLIVLGLCFGSFINALVWRLHEQSLPAKKRAASIEELSISKGRSMCPHCKHTLGALDLLPLVSWLFLRGKCRYCKHPIGRQYPLVEALTALSFVLSYLYWPFDFDAKGIFLLAVWLTALVAFVALAVYDLRWMLLPNKVVFPLIALGAVQVLAVTIFFHGGVRYLVSSLLSVAIAGGIFYVLFQVSRGEWIGGGDVKLGYAIGLLLASPFLSFLVLFVASLLGLLAALPGLVSKKLALTGRIPFGPYLIAATAIVMCFGHVFADWYVGGLLRW